MSRLFQNKNSWQSLHNNFQFENAAWEQDFKEWSDDIFVGKKK